MGDLYLDDDDDFSTGLISTKESGQGDYGLRIRGRRRDFSSRKVETGCGTYSASCSARGYFPVVKDVEA